MRWFFRRILLVLRQTAKSYRMLPFPLSLASPFEYLGKRWAYWWGKSAALRFSVELVGACAFLLGVYGLVVDLWDRREERLVRMWQIATDDRPGNSGKIPALEFLNQEGHSLEGIEIPKSYLVGVQLPEASLAGSDLSQANLIYANLSGANLFGANLSEANLSRATLVEANLSLADLSLADLSGADLSGADLSGANLSGADLFRANLSWAYLSEADLSGADLSGADLSEVKGLTQAQVDSTACDYESVGPPVLPDGLRWHDRICE